MADGPTTHGHRRGYSSSPTYRSWCAMITRCTNKNSRMYKEYYGALGITVCPRWRSFAAFLADMGERPSEKHSLDRWPNKTGNYEPSNVRWATMSEQCRNRKTTRPVVRSDGLAFPSIVEAAEMTGSRRQDIQAVCSGKQKTHLGFAWRYASHE